MKNRTKFEPDTARNLLRDALGNYMHSIWVKDIPDDELERYLSGVMAFIATEIWNKPFTPLTPPTILEQIKEEDE